MPGSSSKRHHNLPAHRVHLIGRDQDLAVARGALLGTEGRLLTLIGTGGCGKTRLALELASELVSEFRDGVWLVELAPLADARLVPQAIASALGVRDQPGESLLATLVRLLSRRELLLVLDNCEHVIEVCARVVEDVLDQCPRLRVVATSREALRIAGEKTWRVPSLAVPDQRARVDDQLRSPAVQLFVERAQAAVADFAVAPPAITAIGCICRRLDGLPLAIELAAARVRTLGVAQILERLDDSIRLLVGGGRTAPSRQQTLLATLDWSYGLLSDAEQALFRGLAVFAESFSLDAIEAVCANGAVPASDVLDLLTQLVDKSLVVVVEHDGHARYRLLEPVRQYAHELLVARDERDAACRRHGQHYLAFAEARSHDANIGGSRRMAAVTELAVEYPNIRSALAWFVCDKETQLGLRLAGTLDFLWQTYGSVNEGIQWVDKLMALPGADEPTTARAWALLSAGYLAQLHGDFEVGEAFCHEALAIGRGVGDGVLEWEALLFCAINRFTAGDLATAVGYGQHALVCARAAKDPITEAQSLCVLALIACARADFTTARPLAEQAQRLGRADPWIEAWSLAAVGRAAYGRGALGHARAALEASLALARQHGDPPSLTAFILDALGDVGTALNQPRSARAWLVSSLELRHGGGERFLIAQTLDRMAALAAMWGEAERALRLAGAADALYEGLGGQRGSAERDKLEQWLLPLRDVHGGEAADVAWAEGRALELDDAIALALSSNQADAEQPTSTEPAHTGSVLSTREEEVAVLLVRGLTNRQIADELVISIHTAERHVENILGKLGFNSRTQVAAWAIGNGLAPIPAQGAPR